METAKILEILGYTLPSLVTGCVAYFLFESYFKDQQNTRRWLLQKETKKDLLPLRLQAYERLTLLMERIHPAQILLRNSPVTNDKKEYENLITDQIQHEFEHNLSQQIYVANVGLSFKPLKMPLYNSFALLLKTKKYKLQPT